MKRELTQTEATCPGYVPLLHSLPFIKLKSPSFFFYFASSLEHVKTVRVPAGQDVLVPCPNVTSDVMKFKLHLNGELIHTEWFPHEGQRGDRETRVVNGNGTFDLWVGRVNSSSHDVYWCEVDVIYPPPMVTQCSSQWILPQVEGKDSGSRVISETLQVH